MTMHQHTKFGYKRFNSSGNIVLGISNLCGDRDLVQRNQIFHRTLEITMMDNQSKFNCKQIESIENIQETAVF